MLKDKKSKIKKYVFSKTQPEVNNGQLQVEDQVPIAQMAKHELREMSLSQCRMLDGQIWDINSSIIVDAPQAKQQMPKESLEIQRAKSFSSLKFKISAKPTLVARQSLYQTTKKVQIVGQNQMKKRYLCSSIKLDFSDIQKDARIHSVKIKNTIKSKDKSENCFLYHLTKSNLEKEKFQNSIQQLKKIKQLKKSQISAKSRIQTSQTANAMLKLALQRTKNQRHQSENRKNSFSQLKHQIEARYQEKTNCNYELYGKCLRKASFLCTIVRKEIKEINDKAKFNARRFKLMQEKVSANCI